MKLSAATGDQPGVPPRAKAHGQLPVERLDGWPAALLRGPLAGRDPANDRTYPRVLVGLSAETTRRPLAARPRRDRSGDRRPGRRCLAAPQLVRDGHRRCLAAPQLVRDGHRRCLAAPQLVRDGHRFDGLVCAQG